MPTDAELVELEARREELREQYLRPAAERPPTPGRGIHHAALICSDVEQTIQFYQDLLGLPAGRAGREPRLRRLVALLLRPRQQDPAGLLRLPRARARARRRGDRRRPAHRDLGSRGTVGRRSSERLDEAGVKYAGPGPRDRGVDVLQGPRRHPDRAAQRPADVLRRQAARRVAQPDRQPATGEVSAMSEWNAMTYEGKDTILRVVRHEAERLFALADSAEAWERADRVRGLVDRATSVAHIVDTTEGYFRAFDAARGGGEAPAPHGLPVMAQKANEGATALPRRPAGRADGAAARRLPQDAGDPRRRSVPTTGPASWSPTPTWVRCRRSSTPPAS